MFDCSKVVRRVSTVYEVKKCLNCCINLFRSYTNGQVSCNTTDKTGTDERKILKVAIIGCPNAGKSTLINQIVQRSIFAVSKKVHTTRCRAKGVFVEGNTQLVFLDTPGLVSFKESQKYKLSKRYVSGGEDAIAEADVIGVIHDVSLVHTRNRLDPKVTRLLYLYPHKESFLVLNKIDMVKSKRFLLDLLSTLTGGHLRRYTAEKDEEFPPLSEFQIQEKIEEDPQWRRFSDVFLVSALLGQGTDQLRTYLLNGAHPGKWIFSEDICTDQNPVRRIEEAVRSKLLEHLPNEVPYILDVELEYLDIKNPDTIVAVVLVGCKTEKLQRMVKGLHGERIKVIASEAEQELENFFLKSVHLKVVITGKAQEETIPLSSN